MCQNEGLINLTLLSVANDALTFLLYHRQERHTRGDLADDGLDLGVDFLFSLFLLLWLRTAKSTNVSHAGENEGSWIHHQWRPCGCHVAKRTTRRVRLQKVNPWQRKRTDWGVREAFHVVPRTHSVGWFSFASSSAPSDVVLGSSSATSNCHRSTTSLVSLEMMASTSLETLPASSQAGLRQ